MAEDRIRHAGRIRSSLEANLLLISFALEVRVKSIKSFLLCLLLVVCEVTYLFCEEKNMSYTEAIIQLHPDTTNGFYLEQGNQITSIEQLAGSNVEKTLLNDPNAKLYYEKYITGTLFSKAFASSATFSAYIGCGFLMGAYCQDPVNQKALIFSAVGFASFVVDIASSLICGSLSIASLKKSISITNGEFQ